MHLLTRARPRDPAQVLFLALLGLVAAGWALVALDGGQFLTLESVVGIQQREGGGPGGLYSPGRGPLSASPH